MPGPGSYGHLESIGKGQFTSTMGSTQRFSMPQAKDRFMSPTMIRHNAAPGSYSPAASMVEHTLSNHKQTKRTKFSLDRSDILDQRWRVKDQSSTPGPGAY